MNLEEEYRRWTKAHGNDEDKSDEIVLRAVRGEEVLLFDFKKLKEKLESAGGREKDKAENAYREVNRLLQKIKNQW